MSLYTYPEEEPRDEGEEQEAHEQHPVQRHPVHAPVPAHAAAATLRAARPACQHMLQAHGAGGPESGTVFLAGSEKVYPSADLVN